MPSGFQLDNNQLSPGYYRVVIEMGANSPQASWTGTDDAPYDGKITPYAWDACAYSSITNLFDGTNQYLTDALARGNLRFQAIVETLELVGDCQILDVETYADDDIENMANNGWIAFTVKYDRPAFIGLAYNKIQEQDNISGDYDNGSNGTTTLEGVTYKNYWSASGEEATINVDSPQDAIRDLVWRALARPTWSRLTRVFDVAKEEGVQAVIEVGNPTNGSEFSYSMWEDISVQEINGTTNTIQAD